MPASDREYGAIRLASSPARANTYDFHGQGCSEFDGESPDPEYCGVGALKFITIQVTDFDDGLLELTASSAGNGAYGGDSGGALLTDAFGVPGWRPDQLIAGVASCVDVDFYFGVPNYTLDLFAAPSSGLASWFDEVIGDDWHVFDAPPATMAALIPLIN